MRESDLPVATANVPINTLNAKTDAAISNVKDDDSNARNANFRGSKSTAKNEKLVAVGHVL